jgi:hypothetical protein
MRARKRSPLAKAFLRPGVGSPVSAPAGWTLDLDTFADRDGTPVGMTLRPSDEWPGFDGRHISTAFAERRVSISIPRVPPCQRCRLEMTLCANSEMTASVMFNGRPIGTLLVLKVSCFSLFLPLTENEAGRPFHITMTFSDPINPLPDNSCLGLPPVRHIKLRGTTSLGITIARIAAGAQVEDHAPSPSQITDRELMGRFMSIGDNCELGIAQRYYGAEPLDLYRFSGVPLGWIIEGIDNEFAGIDGNKPDQFYLAAHPKPDGVRYYFGCQLAYRIPYETGIPEAQAPLAKVRATTLMRLKRLGEKLIDDLKDGVRIVAIKRDVPYSFAEIDAICRRLRRYGRCWLLLIELGNSERPHTAVEIVAPGVLRGYLGRFADGTRVVDTTDHAAWLVLCRRAYDVWWRDKNGLPSRARLPIDFDPLSYLEQNPDVACSGMNPTVHYLAYGAYEGRSYLGAALGYREPLAERAASAAPRIDASLVTD